MHSQNIGDERGVHLPNACRKPYFDRDEQLRIGYGYWIILSADVDREE